MTTTTTADIVANPDQSDLDGRDDGDACDRDDDGDRFDDAYDNCPTVYNLEPSDVNGDGLINDQLDRDGDGIGTACDADEPVIQGPGPGSDDRRRPRLSVGIARRHELDAVRAGLVVRLRCSEACGTTVDLVLDRRTARRLGLRRSRILASGSARLQGAGTTYAFLRFDPRARRALFGQRRIRGHAHSRGGGRRRQPPSGLAAHRARPLTQARVALPRRVWLIAPGGTRIWQHEDIGGDSSGIFHPGVGAGVAGWRRIDSLPGLGAGDRLGRHGCGSA